MDKINDMDKLKDLLHELRCDIAAIPESGENKKEIDNAQETLSKAWAELLRLYNVAGQSEQLPCFLYENDGGIFIGYHGDTNVTEEWNDYLKTR